MTPIQFGAYLLVERLGGGATGDTFLALAKGEPLVIKRLHAELAREAEFVERFRHEALTAAALSSPHLARVFEHGRVGDVLFIAMEHVPGWTVARIMKELIRRGALAAPEACVAVVADALEGLAALHDARDEGGRSISLVHRDVAPQNLIVGTDRRARLIDLGLGKSRLGAWQTRTGRVMGSPGYMAPEQALAKATDHRTDLYSMAVVFHDLLTLEPLIPRAPLHQMLASAGTPIRRPLSETRPDAPAPLEPILARALAVDPSERYQSAAELLSALTSAIPLGRRDQAIAGLITHMMSSELEATRVDYQHRPVVAERRRARWPYAAAAAMGLLVWIASRVPEPEDRAAGRGSPPIAAPLPVARPQIFPRSVPAVDAGAAPRTKVRRVARSLAQQADAGSRPPPPELDQRARLDRMLARAQRLRRSTADQQPIDDVIAELLRLRFEGDVERPALDAIEGRLDRIEP